MLNAELGDSNKYVFTWLKALTSDLNFETQILNQEPRTKTLINVEFLMLNDELGDSNMYAFT